MNPFPKVELLFFQMYQNISFTRVLLIFGMIVIFQQNFFSTRFHQPNASEHFQVLMTLHNQHTAKTSVYIQTMFSVHLEQHLINT